MLHRSAGWPTAGSAWSAGPAGWPGSGRARSTAVRRSRAPGRAVVLATGSSAVLPPVPGLAEVRPWDNRSATAAKEIPARLLVLGGGAVGAELAQAFSRLGTAEVTVVEAAPRLLPREEPFAGEELSAAFTREGIGVRLGIP